jgi:hypothetical protein
MASDGLFRFRERSSPAAGAKAIRRGYYVPRTTNARDSTDGTRNSFPAHRID